MFNLAIIGSRPSRLSAAAHAAELGVWGEGDEPGVEIKVYDKSIVKKRFLDYTNAVEA